MSQIKKQCIAKLGFSVSTANRWEIGKKQVVGDDERYREKGEEYGKQVLEQLFEKMTRRYGTGFFIANLKKFEQFYLICPDQLDGIR